jgi:SAM-dependent methyltransferase
MSTESEITRAPQLGHYEIDASRSTVIFRARHMFGLGSVRGTFAVRSSAADIAGTPADGDTGMPARRREDMAAYARYKREVLGSLGGTVLEIGAGYGANFGYLAAGANWIGLEPDPAARRRLATIAAAHGYHRPVIASVAERIPLSDASVDAVAGTLVLCSVTDQAMALAQVRRVLRPGGRYVFFEHVAAPRGTASRGLQRCCAPLSRRLAAGCDPARETWRAIAAAGFRDVQFRWFSRRPAIGLLSHYLAGVAHA